MTERMERRPRRRRQIPLLAVAALVAAVAIFAVGIALGEALHDNPRPNLTVTSTKTLLP